MAEIHVEPRRRSRAWLWVLLLVIVLVVAAWVLFGGGLTYTAFGGTFVVDAVTVAFGGAPPGGGMHG